MTRPSPQFDDQTSPQVQGAITGRFTSKVSTFKEVPRADARCKNCPPNICLFPEPISDEPVILWDQITQRNCMVLDCFSSQMFEETTYWQLQPQGGWQDNYLSFWRRDDQVEEQAIFYTYDAGELCWEYTHQFGKSYKGSPASIKAIIEVLLSRKADVSHRRTRDGGREIIADLSDMIVQAMHWKEEGGLGYE